MIELSVLLLIICCIYSIYNYIRSKKILRDIKKHARKLTEIVDRKFLVKSCSRCHEYHMKLISVSPNARSVEYQCTHCKKKMRAPAGSPDANDACVYGELLTKSILKFQRKYPKKQISAACYFTVPKSLMPYKQTVREPITEAMRTEVWRRDGGQCVQCVSKQNLHFDHIIPVSKGGATCVENLQLLCQTCNLSKGAKI